MSRSERELVIKSSLFAHRVNTSQTSTNRKKEKIRKKPSQTYFFMGQKICKKMFVFAHAISCSTLQKTAISLDKDGILPRVHGNTGKLPANALCFEDRQNVKDFIHEYAIENALPLPGRLPNCPDRTMLLLPSDKSIAQVHDLYNQSAELSHYRQISLKTFRSLWNDLCPQIALAKPMTDLCMTCQTFGSKLSQTGQFTDEQKNEIVISYKSHLDLAHKQREQYREMTASSKQIFLNENLHEGVHYHTKICWSSIWIIIIIIHFHKMLL